MFDHLLKSSDQGMSKKWSNLGFCEEITQVELIEVNLMLLIRNSANKNVDNEIAR